MKRLRKILLWVFGVTAGLLVAAWFGVKGYINSSYGRQTAATQISEIVGLPVEVESLSVGTGSTSASLKVNDTAAPDPSADLLKIGSLETDISLFDLVSGRVAPTTVTLKDVEFLLRIDADGKILSPLPKPKGTGGGAKTLPAIELVNGRVRIQQAGHPEFSASGLAAKLTKDGDGYALAGTGDDPQWGKWTITGRLTADPAGSVQFHTDRTTVSTDMLRSLPYVPLNVWDEVVPSGDTAATVTLDYQPGRGMGYGVALNLLKATLGIPAVSVTLKQVEGVVKVGDDKVRIEGGRGTLASGQVTTDGTYDFSHPTGVFTSKITTNKVDVKQLPDEWGLKRLGVGGGLRGDADIVLRFPPKGKVETHGSGKGDIEGATVLNGIPAVIKIRMKGGKDGYQFQTF